ncbi:hypothetical protein DYU05_14805 [Mucilaginibacter terrenus]|uniref:tRNA (Guanine-N1)-methyltransferase n=1 Tax=Mucilaginibacter terrenus TaxID=2482727 RepID=A0A3E2NR90_9SPHI|nr:hypothetical protein [Mucilaginibacter terrenus]RFZ83400.1 hypothetical protein DYU05_14805 [Mucilaginibacter terrenus]
MTKFFPPLLIALLFVTAGTYNTQAQDTSRKARPAPVKVGIRPPVKVNTYTAKPLAAKAATQVPAVNGAAQPAAKSTQQYQATDPALLNDKSLNGQYQYLLTRVYHYQQPLISALWKNFSDTLNVTKRKLKEVNTKLAEQTKRADTLQTQLNSNEQTLSQSNAKVDEVKLLGIPLTKATYNWIMWGLVIGFGAIAAIVIARAGSHSREAKYRTKLYNELEEEYKNFKVKANEKEKKLARELQTERNRLDELTGRE